MQPALHHTNSNMNGWTTLATCRIGQAVEGWPVSALGNVVPTRCENGTDTFCKISTADADQ